MIAISCVVIIGLALTIITFLSIKGGQWVCVTNKCVSYVEGEEWVAQNCKPSGDNNEMICEFMYQDQAFRVPLSGINKSSMRSCAEYTCDYEAYVRRSG